jgi:hypothetical protein
MDYSSIVLLELLVTHLCIIVQGLFAFSFPFLVWWDFVRLSAIDDPTPPSEPTLTLGTPSCDSQWTLLDL